MMSNLFYKEPIIRVVKARRGTGKTKSLAAIGAAIKGRVVTVSDYPYLNIELNILGVSYSSIISDYKDDWEYGLLSLRGKYPPSVILVDDIKNLNRIDEVIDTSFYRGIVYVAYTPSNNNHVYTGKYQVITTDLTREFTEEQEELLDEIRSIGWENFRDKYLDIGLD